MNLKLLIVEDIDNTAFLDSYRKNKNLYKKWDIYYCSKTSREEKDIKYWNNLSIDKILTTYKNLYKHFLIIKSSDFFIKDYKLDLVSSVIEFPTIDRENTIEMNQNSKDCIILNKNIYYKLINFNILEKDNWKLSKHSYQYVNYLFILKNKNSFKIDYVFPYVNCNDPLWQKNYIKYKDIEAAKIEETNSKDARYEKNYSTGLQRFRDSGLMKYVLRSVEKNMPFINKLHIIVSNKSQVPSWINTDIVDIITHDEFMPKELLPTFSSSEIEMFLPFLPRVSEHFIYGNDDEFIMKLQKTYHWFFDEKTVTYSGVRPIVANFTGDIFRHNDYNLIAPENNFYTTHKMCLDQQHCPQPYLLSKMKECYNKYEKQILASCTRFRENEKNYNQWIYLAYNALNGFVYQKKRACYTSDLSKWNKSINLNNYTCLCMNDSSEDLNSDNVKDFIDKMNNFFPNKSVYER